jgi:hypothetical protein
MLKALLKCFCPPVDQTLMIQVLEALVDRSRMVNGKPMSLVDIGYNDMVRQCAIFPLMSFLI